MKLEFEKMRVDIMRMSSEERPFEKGCKQCI